MKSEWDKYYSTNLNLKEYLGNLAGHSTLFEHIIHENPSKILEVGVGTGSMSIFLSHLGFSVTGVDNNGNVLDNAAKLCEQLNGNVKLVNISADKLSEEFDSDNFDVIFSQGFFEHFTDKEIGELISEQLKVGKIIFISVPSNFYPKKDLGDERLLSVDEWKEILNKINIKVDFVKYYSPALFGVKPLIKNFLKDPKLPITKPGHVLIKIKK